MSLRFVAASHRYFLDGAPVPSISSLLDRAGLVNSEWMTEASRIRGTEVHALCERFDLGALDPATCQSPHRAYLLAHVAAMAILQPTFLAIEEPRASRRYRYAGTPDRELILHGVRGVLEGKAAQPAKSHPIQTALQAILVAEDTGIPPEQLGRWVLYLQPNGRYKLVAHERRQDIAEALEILRRFAC